jgi:hypothetical protein
VLVAIVKKRLDLSASLYEMLQILSLIMFERMPLNQLLTKSNADRGIEVSTNQLNLFDYVGTLLPVNMLKLRTVLSIYP